MSGAGAGSGGGAATGTTSSTGTQVHGKGKVKVHTPGEVLDLSECLEEVRDALGTRYIHPDTITEAFAEFDADNS